MSTSVNVSANLVVAGQPVTLSSQDIAGGGIFFTLPHPVILGTPDDFLNWFINTFNPPTTEIGPDALTKVNDKIKMLPPPLNKVADTLLHHDEIILDTLVINTADGIYQFGISMRMTDDKGQFAPVNIVSNLAFEGMGFYFEKKPASTTLADDVAGDKSVNTLTVVENSDVATFEINDVIKIDNERMTVSAKQDANGGKRTLTVARDANVGEHKKGAIVLDVMPAPTTVPA